MMVEISRASKEMLESVQKFHWIHRKPLKGDEAISLLKRSACIE